METPPPMKSGKVRDIYDAGEAFVLVASDRVSAFDVILPTPIPDKGKVLTQLSNWWFAQTNHIAPKPPPRNRERTLPRALQLGR
jgi:phosphoribosylaminoimidazole-succinocarboxamide synthase